MTGLIILAAGASSRLGRPKQNLIYNEKTLLQHSIDVALASKSSIVVLVLGSNMTTINPEVSHKKLHITINDNWSEGMSSSIKCGLEKLLKLDSEISEVLLMLCDQPFVDAHLINKLIDERQKSGKRIAACSYAKTLGTPAIFYSSLFPELLSLNGSQGAKNLIKKYLEEVVSVPFPLGEIDIDTMDDFDNLLGLNNL